MQTIILEIEGVWREKKRKDIYERLWTKYAEFCEKYKEAQKWLCEEGDAPALRDELMKKDEELLASIERFNALEGELKRKEEEL